MPTRVATAPESEKAVLGACLVSAEGCDTVFEILQPGNFHSRANQIIAGGIRELRVSGSCPPDLVGLSDWLLSRGQLDDAGGPAYLAELSNVGYSDAPDFIRGHASRVADAGAKRTLATLAMDISENAVSREVTESIRVICSRLEQIQSARAPYGTLSIKQLAMDAFHRIEERHKNGLGVTGVSTGFMDLDRLTAGLHGGELVLLAARPSVGKTALAIQIALNAAQSDRRVAVFSLEMSAGSIAERLLSMVSQIDASRIRSGRLRESEWEPLARAEAELGVLPLVIDDRSALTVNALKSAARHIQNAGGLSLVVIDYLQLLRGARAENRNQEVAAISRELKALAKDLGVPVLALSQLSRFSDKRPDRRPALSDLRDSGALEQDADVVFMLHRDDIQDPTDRAAELVVAKQRNGPTGSVTFEFDAARARFIELLSSPTARRAAR